MSFASSNSSDRDFSNATKKLSDLKAAGSLTPAAIASASSERAETLLSKFSRLDAIKTMLDSFGGIIEEINLKNAHLDRRESMLVAKKVNFDAAPALVPLVSIEAGSIDDLAAFTAGDSGEVVLGAGAGAGSGVVASSDSDIGCLFTSAALFASSYADGLSRGSIDSLESLLKTGPAFMSWNNDDPGVSHKYTYHDFPHGAEMLMDTLLKSSILVFQDEKFSFLSKEQKKNLVILLALCASYHDSYFRGTRMLDEAASAQLVIKLLGECADLKVIPEDLASFIELMILSGTLPIFGGEKMPALIETLRKPESGEQARIVLFDLACLLGTLDVHRTNDGQLRSLTRIETFNLAVSSDENLAAGLERLKLIARALYNDWPEAFRNRYSFEDCFEALLDKCGQNIRMGNEQESSTQVRSLIGEGRDLLQKKDYLLMLDQEDFSDAEVIKCFNGLVHPNNARFMLVFARTVAVGDDFNLWNAHSLFLNKLEEKILSDDDKKQVGTLLALRAGAQDGVHFNKLLAEPVFSICGMVEDLYDMEPEQRAAITMDGLIASQSNGAVVSAVPFRGAAAKDGESEVEAAELLEVEAEGQAPAERQAPAEGQAPAGAEPAVGQAPVEEPPIRVGRDTSWCGCFLRFFGCGRDADQAGQADQAPGQ